MKAVALVARLASVFGDAECNEGVDGETIGGFCTDDPT